MASLCDTWLPFHGPRWLPSSHNPNGYREEKEMVIPKALLFLLREELGSFSNQFYLYFIILNLVMHLHLPSRNTEKRDLDFG
jgi:hypothetical protein